MKKINQADGSFRVELEAADGDILRALGRRPGRLRGTFTDASQLHPVIADALPSATVIEYTPPPEPDPAVVADQEARRILAETDAVHGARGTEDLVASLIAKGILSETDLAPEYLDRKTLRDAVRADLLTSEV